MNNIYNLIMIVILAASLVWPNLKWKCGNYKHFPFTDENVQENLNELNKLNNIQRNISMFWMAEAVP